MPRKIISKDEERQLLLELAQSLSALETSEEMMQLIVDLLSKSEVRMLARRLKTARLLIAGKTYKDIRKMLGISFSTVARVATWLSVSGSGYRIVVERTRISADAKDEKQVQDVGPRLWHDIRRKYPAYYWPQLLLEEVVRSARKRDRERLAGAVRQLDTKSNLFKQLDSILRNWGVDKVYKKRYRKI